MAMTNQRFFLYNDSINTIRVHAIGNVVERGSVRVGCTGSLDKICLSLCARH